MTHIETTVLAVQAGLSIGFEPDGGGTAHASGSAVAAFGQQQESALASLPAAVPSAGGP